MATKILGSGTQFVNTSGTSVVYQAPAFVNSSGCAIIISCLISNGSVANPRVTQQISQGSTTVSLPTNNLVIPSGSSVETVPNKLVLVSGQSLRTTFTSSGSLSVSVAVLEIY